MRIYIMQILRIKLKAPYFGLAKDAALMSLWGTHDIIVKQLIGQIFLYIYKI